MEQSNWGQRPAQWELGAPKLQTVRSGMASAVEHFIHYEDAAGKVRSMSLDGTTESLRPLESLVSAGSLQHALFDAQACVSRRPSLGGSKAVPPLFNGSKAQHTGPATASMALQQTSMPPPAVSADQAVQQQQQMQKQQQQQHQQQLLQQSMQQTYQSIMAMQPRNSISDGLSAHADPYALPSQPSLPPVRTMTGRTLERLFEEAESAFGAPLSEAASMPLLFGSDDAANMGPILRYNSSDVLREFGAMLRSNSLQIFGDGTPLATAGHANGSSNGGSASTPVSGDGSMMCSFPVPTMPFSGHSRPRQQSPFGPGAMQSHSAPGHGTHHYQQQQQLQHQHQQLLPASPVRGSYRREGGKQAPGSFNTQPNSASPLSFSAGSAGAGSPGVSKPQARSRSARTSLANPSGTGSPTLGSHPAAPARHSAPSGQLRRKLSASDDSSSFSADGDSWRPAGAGDAEAEGGAAKGSVAKRPRTSTPNGKPRTKGVRKAERFADNKGGRIHCLNCGTHQTPQWRCGPEGPRTLCNACGVRFKKGLPLPYMEKKKRDAAAAAAAANAGGVGAGALVGGGVGVMGQVGVGQQQVMMMGGGAMQHSMYGRPTGQFGAAAWRASEYTS